MEILTIQFQNQLTFKEIPFFRGALLHSLPEESNLLLHNHIDMGYRYAYPLVQYKSINGKAAVVCLNEGIDSVMQLIEKEDLQIRIGNRREQPLLIDKISPIKTDIAINHHLNCYHIKKWVALNSDNYARYMGLQRLSDRVSFLENILTANILSFLKGINVYIDNELECHLLNVSDKYSIKTNKGVKMIAFDASFQINIELPDYIGLGKHSSLGYGLITKEKHNN